MVVGVVAAAMLVACGEPRQPSVNEVEPETYEVRVDVEGMELAAFGDDDRLVLDNNGEQLEIEENGTFVFPTELENGEEYEVTVVTEPPQHTCEIDNGSGTIVEAPVLDLVVSCEYDDSDQGTPPHYVVTIDESASELDVDKDHDLEFAADVENTGEQTGQQDIEFYVDGNLEATESDVEIEGGENQTVTFAWETDEAGPGYYEGAVSSGDDVDTAFGTVRDEDGNAAPYFAVEIDEEASDLSVNATQTVAVHATIHNLGDDPATQDIDVTMADEFEETRTDVAIDGGDSQTLIFEWSTDHDHIGNYGATVSSEDHTDSAGITVNAPAGEYVGVAIDDEQSTFAVEEGQTVSLSVELQNFGSTTANQDITLEVDGTERDALEDYELDAGTTDTVTLEWQTGDGDDGIYEAVVSSHDESDTATVAVSNPDATPWLAGDVLDAETGEAMEGADLLVYEQGTDTLADSITIGADGSYEIQGLEEQAYDLKLEATGLEPNYSIEEAGGDGTAEVSLGGGANVQDLSVDWARTTDLMLDGEMLDLQYDNPDSNLFVLFPGCDRQADGSWQPDYPEPSEMDVTYEPEGECFRLENVDIDLATGEMTAETADAEFPNAIVFIPDDDDEMHEEVEGVEVEFEWLFDHIGGEVDFSDGSMQLDLDVRILVGGTVESTTIYNPEFGSRDGFYDCQLTSAWGGDVTDPQEDDNDDQIGGHLHDPVQLRLTTGQSGPNDAEGIPYDAGDQLLATVDNTLEVGRLSEGEFGNDDPAGSSCGQVNIDVVGFTFQEDFAAHLNDELQLPRVEGDAYGEFWFAIP